MPLSRHWASVDDPQRSCQARRRLSQESRINARTTAGGHLFDTRNRIRCSMSTQTCPTSSWNSERRRMIVLVCSPKTQDSGEASASWAAEIRNRKQRIGAAGAAAAWLAESCTTAVTVSGTLNPAESWVLDSNTHRIPGRSSMYSRNHKFWSTQRVRENPFSRETQSPPRAWTFQSFRAFHSLVCSGESKGTPHS